MVAWGPSRRRLLVLATAALAVAMILPRLGVDYGADGDARRSVAAALRLATTGEYRPSRLPGNPLFEIVLAAIVPWGGPVASNLFSAVSYALCVAAFYRLARGGRHALLLTASFALTPALLVNGASTIDYVPGLALLLWSYVALRDERTWLSAILLGLATGFRVTNLLFLVPLCLFLLLRAAPPRRIFTFTGATVVLGLAAYVPVVESAGEKLLAMPPQSAPPLQYAVLTIARWMTVLGIPALCAVVVLLLVHRRRAAAVFAREWRRISPPFAVEVATVVVFSAVFLLHSDERDYLLPIVPFSFLLVGRWLPARGVALLAACVIAPAFVAIDPRAGEGLLRPGLIPADIAKREELTRLRADIACLADQDRSVILTRRGPVLTHENAALEHVEPHALPFRPITPGIEEPENIHRLRGREVYFVYDLSLENRQRAFVAGYRVHSLFAGGVDPDRAGIFALPLAPDALCSAHAR
jgi:hypothetical protein